MVAFTLEQSARTQGPAEPHCALDEHVAGTPDADSGKYCSPTPRPAEAGSFTKADIAVTTALHLDCPAATRSSIDPDASIMKKRSRGASVALRVVAAQPANVPGLLASRLRFGAAPSPLPLEAVEPLP